MSPGPCFYFTERNNKEKRKKIHQKNYNRENSDNEMKRNKKIAASVDVQVLDEVNQLHSGRLRPSIGWTRLSLAGV